MYYSKQIRFFTPIKNTLKKISFNLLLIWMVFLFLSILIFLFLHECAHGFGSQLDGFPVSTGFNRIGDVGKRPRDPDFRSEHIVEGELRSGALLGPFTNWMFAITLTGLILHREKTNNLTLLLMAGAVSNSLMRLIPMLGFFLAALGGKLVLEDEVEWGLRSIQGLEFPMFWNDFQALISQQNSLFLSEPRIYFWPLISFFISFICVVYVYLRIFKLFCMKMNTRIEQWLFGLMPLLIWPLISIAANKLDNLIRINW